MTKTLLELPIVAGAIGELQMPDAVLLATLVPLADVATGVLVSPSAHFDRPCAVLALTLALLVVSMLTLLVGVLLVLVLDSGRGHAHAAHWVMIFTQFCICILLSVFTYCHHRSRPWPLLRYRPRCASSCY